MRICIYGASENLGGTEMYMISLARALKGVVYFDFLVGHNVGTIPFEEEITELGGRVIREYYSIKEKKNANYISPKELFRKHKEWSAVYVNLQHINTAYRLCVEAKKQGVKYRILHSHNSNWVKKPGIKDYIYLAYFRMTNRYVLSHRFSCSSFAGKWMFGDRRGCEIIPNPIDFSLYIPNDEKRTKMREELGIRRNEKVIGFLGRLTEQKNPIFLLDIIERIEDKETKLLIVGNGNMREKIEEEIAKRQLVDRVIMVGEVTNPQDYYQCMDCFVSPSLFEGFGIVFLEAQAFGLKCYAPKGRVPEETNITGNICFLELADNPDFWASIIQKFGFERSVCRDVLDSSSYSFNKFKEKMYSIFSKMEL